MVMTGNRRDTVGEQMAPRSTPSRGLFPAIFAKFGMGQPLSDQERIALAAAAGSDNAVGAYNQSFIQQADQFRERSLEDDKLRREKELHELTTQLSEQRLKSGAQDQTLNEGKIRMQGLREVVPGSGIFVDLLNPGSGQLQFPEETAAAIRRANKAKASSSASSQESFFAPEFGTDAEGNLVALQGGNRGSFKTQTLAGFDPVNTTAIGKADANYLEDVRDQAEAAGDVYRSASQAVSLADNVPEGFRFGLGASAQLAADKARLAAGADDPGLAERVAFGEKVVSLQNEQFVSNSGPLKGALSNKEGERITQIGSQLGDTQLGFRMKAEIRALEAKRSQDRAEFIASAIRERRMSPEEAKREWEEENRDNGTVDQILQKYQNASRGSSSLDSSAGKINFRRID